MKTQHTQHTQLKTPNTTHTKHTPNTHTTLNTPKILKHTHMAKTLRTPILAKCGLAKCGHDRRGAFRHMTVEHLRPLLDNVGDLRLFHSLARSCARTSGDSGCVASWKVICVGSWCMLICIDNLAGVGFVMPAWEAVVASSLHDGGGGG